MFSRPLPLNCFNPRIFVPDTADRRLIRMYSFFVHTPVVRCVLCHYCSMTCCMMQDCNVTDSNIFETKVPGSFELPLAAR